MLKPAAPLGVTCETISQPAKLRQERHKRGGRVLCRSYGAWTVFSWTRSIDRARLTALSLCCSAFQQC